MMSAVRGRENAAERRLRSALWRLGYRYRLQAKHLVGRPDLVLPKYRAVIFVDGDFWHGRALREGGDAQLRQVIRGARFDWWRAKLARTIERDDSVRRELMSAGWRVIRIWESDIQSDLDAVVRRIRRLLRK